MSEAKSKLPVETEGAEEPVHWVQMVRELRAARSFEPETRALGLSFRRPGFWGLRTLWVAGLWSALPYLGPAVHVDAPFVAGLALAAAWSVWTMGAVKDEFTGEAALDERVQLARWSPVAARAAGVAVALLLAVVQVILHVPRSRLAELAVSALLPLLGWVGIFWVSDWVMLRRGAATGVGAGTRAAMRSLASFLHGILVWVTRFEIGRDGRTTEAGERRLPVVGLGSCLAPFAGLIVGAVVAGLLGWVLRGAAAFLGLDPAVIHDVMRVLGGLIMALGAVGTTHFAVAAWTYEWMIAQGTWEGERWVAAQRPTPRLPSGEG